MLHKIVKSLQCILKRQSDCIRLMSQIELDIKNLGSNPEVSMDPYIGFQKCHFWICCLKVRHSDLKCTHTKYNGY